MTASSAVAASRGIAPRPVFCVIQHAHRDLEVAEAACAGRFTLAGRTVELGAEPDWLGAALPRDVEWRIEWTTFSFGLDLAHAYAQTGDARFLRAWERLVGSFLRRLAAGEGAEDASDVAARRVQNWIYAWAMFAAAPGFPGLGDDLEAELLAAIRAHAAHIREHLTAERTHRTIELYALLIVALALPELDTDGGLLRLGTVELHRNLRTDVRPDGVHREHSTHYHCIALRSFLGARENARRFGVALPDGYDEHLSKACDFALHCHRPDGAIPALSDSDNGSHLDLLGLAADLLDRDDLRYAATGGREGGPPGRRYVSFPEGGYHVQRSGWGDRGRALRDERFLIFDCGALGDGGHGHYDLLSVEIAADGRGLVVDPGRHTYDEHEPNLRHWFKGTAAHNTVVVDGLDQVPYRRGKPRKGTTPSARVIERHNAPGLDVIVGEATSTCYEARHQRRIVFVADSYWLIEDRLEGARPHRYDLRFHLGAEAQGHVTVERAGAVHLVRAPGLALLIAGGAAPVVEDGWVSPQYGIKLEAPVVSVVADGDPDATFTTLVVPVGEGEDVPELEVSDRDGISVARVTHADGVDAVSWCDTGADLDLGPLRCRASAGWMRTDGEGVRRVRTAGVGGGAVWTAWDRGRGLSAGREGRL